MSQDKPLEIAIIGIGFTGMMTAVQLIRQATSPLALYLINDKYEFGKGPAYSTASAKHILNVPAAKMSAFADQPNHFLDWAHQQDKYKEIDKEVLGKVFMPRREFGKYLNAIWNEAVSNKLPDTVIHIIKDIAVDISTELGKNIITLESNKTVSADYVILSTGNESPRNLPVSDPTLYDDPNYIGDPWNNKAIENLDPDKDVFIIGNGLTMVDTVLNIMDTGFKGKIHTLSPGGLAISPYRFGYIPYTKMVEELKVPYKLSELFSLISKHVKLLVNAGLSAEPVIDSLRPLTQKIWKELSLEDKQRFLKYMMSTWNQIRHRMPGHMYDYLVRLQLSGRLIVHSGRIVDMTKGEGELTVEILRKNEKSSEKMIVSRIINCIGPSTYIAQSTNPLIRSLVSKGMLQADPLRVGMHVTDQWTLIDRSGKEIPTIYAMGGNLKGLLWETTAVPELRGQAEKMAGELLAKHQAESAQASAQ